MHFARYASSCPSITPAIENALWRTAGSPIPTVSSVNSASAIAIQPTDVTTCSHTSR
ncbi:MAG: hypothetical protein ACRDT4_05865 [Micromonosporaceae bacterium]